MKTVSLVFFFFLHFSLRAQWALTDAPVSVSYSLHHSRFGDYTLLSSPAKLLQRNYGVIVGLQRGRNTSFELCGEAHWRKMILKKSRITGATANMEYNFGHYICGYKDGVCS